MTDQERIKQLEEENQQLRDEIAKLKQANDAANFCANMGLERNQF